MRRVACIHRSNLKETYQQEKITFRSELETVAIDFSQLIFVEKQQAEQDENYKQLIPYTVLLNAQNRIAIYTRKGNERRLHGLWSAGFGGHIEDFEYSENQSVKELILASVIRELKEEFSAGMHFELRFEGVMNEELTKVGRTHLACVFTARVDESLFTPSDEIEEIQWIAWDEQQNYKMELWSEMAIELLKVKQ